MLPILIILIESLCLLSALLFLRNAGDWWRLFIPYLMCVVLTETTGLSHPANGDNYRIYNLYLPVYILFTLFVLARVCEPLFRVRGLFTVLAFAAAAGYLTESTIHHFRKISIYTYTFSNAAIVVICCCYFYHLLKQDSFIEIRRHAPFWLVTGLLFFCFGSTISYLFFDTLADINLRYRLPVRQIIFVVLNFILYSCWSYAFLCRYRYKISS